MAYQNVTPLDNATTSSNRRNRSASKPDQPHLSTVSGNNANIHKLSLLLDIEAEVRKAATVDEWKYVVANETLKITNAIQVFVFNRKKDLRLIAISGLSGFERATPLVKDIERLIAEEFNKKETGNLYQIRELSFSTSHFQYLATYPFANLLWVPFLSREGELIGGKLLAKSDSWEDREQTILKRLADTYSHALSALGSRSPIAGILTRKLVPGRKKILFGTAAIFSTLLMPVSMTVLAPFEVAPTDPVIVASPIEGIINEILVEPNEKVTKGQKLVVFNDTIFRNKLALANRQIGVARARLKKSGLMAFDEQQGREDIGISMANHSLKVTEQKYASDMLERSVIVASRDGVVLFSDRQSLLGVPLKPGERIMQIANPERVELLIDVPTTDAIVLEKNARVKVYLDSDPLNAREASIKYINYQARERAGTGLSFRVAARLNEGNVPVPHMGVRGTAKLFGETVPLAFYLFRRPISALRQWVGL